MPVTSDARPPRVEIPEEVWNQADQLGACIARLALEYGPILTFVPQAGPDRFLPPREEDRRQPYGLVTFGGGPRICLGINFAQLELTALAAHVRRHYRLSRIPNRAIPQVGGIVQNLPEGIPVSVQPLT